MATLRNGFTYTTLLRGDDIRRMPSITIRDVLNSSPNQCSFVVDGQSYAPRPGERIEILDGAELKFSGVVQTVVQTFEGQIDQLAWAVTAVDWVAYANRRRPFGTYDTVPANLIAIDLIQRFAPSFTTAHVQTNLAPVSVTFNGSLTLAGCLDVLAKLLGGGHWYFGYDKDLHFFHIQPPFFAIPTAPPAVMTLGPGTAMTATESTRPGSLAPGALAQGWYVFRSSFVYSNGVESAESPISNPVFMSGSLLPHLVGIPVGPPIGALACVRRNIFYQSYTRNNGTTDWTGWGYVGDNTTTTADVDYVPEAEAQPTPYVAPPAGPAVAPIASELTGTPATTVTTTTSTTTNTTNNSAFITDGYIGPGYGAYAGYTTHIRDGRANQTTWITPPGISAPGNVHPPQGLYGIWYGPLGESGPAGSGGWLPESYFVAALNPVTTSVPVLNPTIHPNLTAGYYAFKVANVYRDGTESLPSPKSNTVALGGVLAVRTANLAIGPTIGGIDVVYRKVYYSIYRPVPNEGTPTFLRGSTGLAGIVPDNTATSLDMTYFLGDANPKSSPSSVAPTWPHADGPSLEDTDLPEDLDENSFYLLLDPPMTSTTDGSQLRNRVIVTGASTSVTRAALAGASVLDVADTTPFFVTGGRALAGSQVLDYEAVSALSGAGAIFLRTPLTTPVAVGIPVTNYIMVEDKESQRVMGQIELDDNDNPTDGIHETMINDSSITTVEAAYTRAFAELELFSRPVVTINYYTRDPLTKAGKTVHVDMRNPPVSGDFLIQDVTVDQFHDESDQLTPRYRVSASSVRFDLTDLLRQIVQQAAGANNTAGLAPTGKGDVGATLIPTPATVTVDDIPLVSDRAIYWTMLAADTFSGTGTPTITSNGWANSVTAGGTGVKDADGYWYHMANVAAGEGSESHLFTPNATWIVANMTGRIRWKFRFVTSVTNFIFFLVLTETSTLIYDGPANGGVTANNAKKGVGIRVDSTGFMPWTASGTLASVGAVFAPVALNTIYYAEVAIAAGVATLNVNGTTTTVAIPAAISATQLLGNMQLFTISGVRSFEWKAVYGERV